MALSMENPMTKKPKRFSWTESQIRDDGMCAQGQTSEMIRNLPALDRAAVQTRDHLLAQQENRDDNGNKTQVDEGRAAEQAR